MKFERPANTPTNKERVLDVLTQKVGKVVTTEFVSVATGLSRDQTTSALHNLKRRGVVKHLGDGAWTFDGRNSIERLLQAAVEVVLEYNLLEKEVDLEL